MSNTKINQNNLITVIKQRQSLNLIQKDLLVLVCVFSFSEYTKGCFANSQTIANQLGTQAKIVQKSLNKLVKNNLLVCSDVKYEGNTLTSYKINPSIFT